MSALSIVGEKRRSHQFATYTQRDRAERPLRCTVLYGRFGNITNSERTWYFGPIENLP